MLDRLLRIAPPRWVPKDPNMLEVSMMTANLREQHQAARQETAAKVWLSTERFEIS